MTLREYAEDHIEELIHELCQYQKCDNCSLGCEESCVLRREGVFAIDKELNQTECEYLNILYEEKDEQ